MTSPRYVASRAAKRKARADLWQAVWEASQYMTSVQIVEFVVSAVAEIESDEP